METSSESSERVRTTAAALTDNQNATWRVSEGFATAERSRGAIVVPQDVVSLDTEHRKSTVRPKDPDNAA
jgi:hypothetical protein